MSALPAGLVPDLDTHVVARMYAAFTGSEWAGAGEWHAAKRINDRFPGTAARMKRVRPFHAATAVEAVRRGASGALIAASGYPSDRRRHDDAFAGAPGARFVFADPEQEVTAVLRTLLGGDRVKVVTASARAPEDLLGRPEVRAIAAGPGEWMGAHLQMCLQFWPAAIARDLIRRYGKHLGRGSELVLSWRIPADTPAGRELGKMLEDSTGAALYRHDQETVLGWLDRAGLKVTPPGVRDIRAGWLEQEQGAVPERIAAVTARRP